MRRAIDETDRRRAIQTAYNEKHGITPVSIAKELDEGLRAIIPKKPDDSPKLDLRKIPKDEYTSLIKDLEGQMDLASANLEFEKAADLRDMIAVFKNAGIRVSIFVDPDEKMVGGAAETGTDRIELYTEGYAKRFAAGDGQAAVLPYVNAARTAKELGLGLNAGHDLDLRNLQFFAHHVPGLLEVSIGHALICDALYLGLENTVQMYKRQLAQ